MKPFSILLIFAAVSCNDVEIGGSKDVSSESIYSEYNITAEEGRDDVTCMIRFRFGGPDGTTLVLEEPARVEMDGQVLLVDSARYTGAFYETTFPASDFEGAHSIVFTDPDGKQHREEFEFTPFRLAAEIPAKLPKKPFEMKIGNLPGSGVPMRLLITDTVFESDDVNQMVRVNKGSIRVDSAMLSRLYKGPIIIELHREEEIPVKKWFP